VQSKKPCGGLVKEVLYKNAQKIRGKGGGDGRSRGGEMKIKKVLKKEKKSLQQRREEGVSRGEEKQLGR